ncbi:putative Macrophage mannose receptor 1 [Hypsibius exemplaris]|uniref:Macrophage mannose receptor 1 n=1 Tax=Hypsibius exemplaris TaxID=2072580 RepID=A0A9X6NFW6_HYPEX|nr:putative Macrophage mannose receptor 1 [Hypsibius exemplaris]
MSPFKSFVELVAVILCLGSASLAIRCPSPDWYNRLTTDKCYYVHGRVGSTASGGPSETLTWAELMSECRVRGGQILTLDDSNEFEWLKANLDGTQRYWIGLTYENLKWEWYDGETYRDFVQSALPGLRVQEPTGNEQSKRQQRGLLRYNGSIKNFEFYMMSATNYNSNGYICRAGLTTRAWCRTEDGWSYRNGRCYRYNVDLRSFSDAERFCLADGGYISVPNTDEENDRLNLWLLNQVKVNIGWIGISVKKNASTTYEDVRWADGAALLTPETNHWKNKDVAGTINKMTVGQSYCGEVWAQRCDLDWCAEEDIVAKWFFNNSCSTRRPFVCETLINKCPYGWTELDEHCYQIHAGSDRLQWQPARDKCKVYGADLVMITTERIQTFLMAAFSAVATWTDPNLFWIGLNNGYTQWLNGTALSYTNWNATVDLTGGGVNGAAYINGDTKRPNSVELGKWFPTVNTQSLNFVCQGHYSSVIPSEVVPLADITCDPPFLKYHRGCYLVVKQKMNRDGAQQYCQAQGNSVLAIVESFGENVWLQNLVTEDSWLGLRITGARPVNGIMRFVYEYSDKRPVGEGAFFNFQDNRHPSNLETMTQFCAVMAGNNSQYNISDFGGKASHGRWFHAPCQEAREFICYHDGTPTAVDTNYDDSHNDPACGAGWFRYGDNCYRVHEDEAPWRLAKQTCQSADPSADLLWMTTKAEQQFIRNFIEKNQSSGIPLGGEEEDYWEEVWEDFYWIDFFADTPTSNWPSEDTEWVSSCQEPVCAYIETSYYSSRWISATCNQAHRYICKKVLARPLRLRPRPRDSTSAWSNVRLSRGMVLVQRTLRPLQSNLLTWLEAQTSCKNIRVDLFSVRNVADFDFLRPFGGGSWIGLNSIVDWHNPRVFEWSDKTPMLYTPWDIESAHSNGSHLGIHDENCGAFTLRGFDMYSCAERKTSVCVAPLIGQIVVAPTGGIAIPQDFGCDPWASVAKAAATTSGWDASRDFCRTRYPGSDLIVINTAEEQAFISLFVNRFGADFWIGLREQAGPVMSAFSRWTDGTAVTAAKWAFGEPQQKPPALRCVALYSQHKRCAESRDWYVDECGTPKFALCEGPRRFVPISPTTPRPVVVEQGCPSGWMTADKGLLPSCYKAYSNSANSTTPKLSGEAEAFCRRFPTGHLATVATNGCH